MKALTNSIAEEERAHAHGHESIKEHAQRLDSGQWARARTRRQKKSARTNWMVVNEAQHRLYGGKRLRAQTNGEKGV